MARGFAAPRWQKNRAALAHAHYTAANSALTPSQTTVLKMIASASDFDTWGRATPCIAHLAALCRLSRSAVEKALRVLRESGLIARDGCGPYMPGRPGARRVVYYRLGSTPDSPLPARVMCARERHDPADACTYCATCDDTHIPKIPTGPVPASGTSSHHSYPAPSRSAEGVRSACTRESEGVNGTPKQRHTRPAPTPPKGRPTPRRTTHPPQAPHPALEIVAHIVSKLTPGQQRHVHARLHAIMRKQGIGPARMAERLRHWRLESPRDPMGWLLYAIKTQPHGCPRPDCENGTLWDPTADVPHGPCEGCSGRIRSRAIGRNLPETSGAVWPPRPEPLGLVDCEWCETPMPKPAPGVFLCRSCRGMQQE